MRIIITVFTFLIFGKLFAGNNEIKLSQDSVVNVIPNEQLDNGFLIKNGLGILSENYGFPKRITEGKFSSIIPRYSLGLEIGNYWYVWRDSYEKMGVAINVNWFDIQIATNSNDIVSATIVNLSLNELGPVFTYTLGPEAAFDIYVNGRLNAIFSNFYHNYYYNGNNYPNDDYDYEDYNQAGLGLTFSAGANFRWQILLIGIGYDFGSISVTTENVNNNYDNYRERINVGLFKIMMGLKF